MLKLFLVVLLLLLVLFGQAGLELLLEGFPFDSNHCLVVELTIFAKPILALEACHITAFGLFGLSVLWLMEIEFFLSI